MKILFLSPTYPFPTNTGGKRRVMAFLQYLSHQHKVTLISLRDHISKQEPTINEQLASWDEYIIDQKYEPRHKTALRAAFSLHIYREIKYSSQDYQIMIEQLLLQEHFDIIWVNFLNMAPYLTSFFNKNNNHRTLIILDQHNVDEHARQSMMLHKKNPIWKIYAGWEMIKARRLQQKWYPHFDVILSVSQEDQYMTKSYVDVNTQVWVAPNGVNLDYFLPVRPTRYEVENPKLVFGGSIEVAMNQDAVYWFVEKVLPLVRKQRPNVEFWIVGRNPPQAIKQLAQQSGIKVTGTVPDVRNYYRQADVFVVPVHLGGGTKLKTLEAMAMALPIVSTTVGVQGLQVNDGSHLFIADEPTKFASRVVELLNDRHQAMIMGRKARQLVKQQYSWTSIIGQVEDRLVQTYKMIATNNN